MKKVKEYFMLGQKVLKIPMSRSLTILDFMAYIAKYYLALQPELFVSRGFSLWATASTVCHT